MTFDELDFNDEAKEIKKVEQNNANQNTTSNNSNNNGGNSYNRPSNSNNSSGYRKFEKAKEVVTENAYVPIAFYLEADFPPNIKAKIKELINNLLSKQYTVRINAGDSDFINSIKDLSDNNLEIYIPWGKLNETDHKRYFGELASKHYFNTETSKIIAQKFFQQGWDKVPDSVKAFLARNVRLLFGDKNNSCALALITWSEDGAIKTTDVGRSTGKSSHVIKMAAYYSIPVYNIQNQQSQEALLQAFNLY